MRNEVKRISINTATVEIKIVKVDGKKLTKSTFNQIPLIDWEEHYKFWIDEQTKEKKWRLTGCKNLGWINVNGIWILCTHRDTLHKVKTPFFARDGISMLEGFVALFDEPFDQLYIAT